MLTLRPYQTKAVESVYDYLRTESGDPCVVLPTAAGKSLCIAQIIDDAVNKWSGRVICLAHRKELLQQNHDELQGQCPHIRSGIYSAGLGFRDTKSDVIFAGIQSVHRRAFELCGDRPFNIVLIDEAHLVPHESDGMYRSFLADMRTANPKSRVVGFTATPYRLGSGMIVGKDGFFDDICHETGVRELVVSRYISELVGRNALTVDLSKVHVKGGEFVSSEAEQAMLRIAKPAVAKLVSLAKDRKSILVFTAGVSHGEIVSDLIEQTTGEEVGFVHGGMLKGMRDSLLNRFRSGELRWLTNINVLTEGYNSPRTDCVALMRATLSPGLYAQMVGRGFRVHPEKDNCLVLDFGNNIRRHGPVDNVSPPRASTGNSEALTKPCPDCEAEISIQVQCCSHCGYEFETNPQPKHDDDASDDDPLSGKSRDEVLEVSEVTYAIHVKKGATPDHPRTLRVEYRSGLARRQSEWICVEHPMGFARAKAKRWWRERSEDLFPADAEHAVLICQSGGVREPARIKVRHTSGKKYPEIVGYEFEDEIPAPCGIEERDLAAASFEEFGDVPF